MTGRLRAETSAVVEVGQELIDAIAAAVDVGRMCEIERLIRVADRIGLGEALRAEIRLVGIDSLGDFNVEVEF